MTVTCPKCSKSLKVKDEYQGKMLKCPQCQTAFRAGGAGGARPATAATAKIQPKPGEKAKKAKAGIAINWTPILIYALLSLIPLAIIAFLLGPMRVKRHWDANQEKVNGDVTDVIDYALQCQASASGLWNPRKSRPAPKVADLRMLPDIFAFSVPPTVRFDGFTSNGTFEGTYTFETGEVDVNMKIEGLTLPSGIHIGPSGVKVAGGMQGDAPSGGVTSAVSKLKGSDPNGAFHVTGRVASGGPQAEIDGKKATIYYPPELDDDGNPIAPPELAPTTKKAA